MEELQKAIQEITYRSDKFPRKAMEVITANREEAIPFLRGAVKKAMEEGTELEENYQLHFYALFLLAEFQDREFFPTIIEFVKLPEDVLDELIGDAITSDLKDILYNTCNGDMELLKTTVKDSNVYEYVRAEMFEVMGQYYLDGKLEENDWKAFLKECVYCGEEYSYFYEGLANVVCRCHFPDMLPEIRYMQEHGLMEPGVLGEYPYCVDEMFAYREYQKNFCSSPLDTVETLKGWAMFSKDEDEKKTDEKARAEFEKQLKAMVAKKGQSASARKVGRNDPCPCGSGKKYKFCCLNKPKSPMDEIESAQERREGLKHYPYIGKERQEGRIYLEDYFDPESIAIDQLIYLGMVQREGLIWERDKRKEEERCRKYLGLAFPMFRDKLEKEGVTSFGEYDSRYSIHYFCGDWIGELSRLLQENGDNELYEAVEQCRSRFA